MDNSFKTFAKHAVKIFTDYLAILFVFVIFSYPIISMSGDKPGLLVRWVSGFLFLLLFALIYKDLQEVAIRERRPQYGINPKPWRGLLLGLAGLVPVWLTQGVIAVLPLADAETLRSRLLQAVSVPIYWLAAILGGAAWLYPVLLLLAALMSFAGYTAGLADFFLMQKIYKLIGYTPKKRVRRKPRKKTGRGFWGI
jgi:hypothetical protein